MLLGVAAVAAAQVPQQGIEAPVPVTHASAMQSASTAPMKPQIAKALLPPDFAGEPREGDIVIEPSPAGADAAHAAVLKEDGFIQSDTAKYVGAGGAGWTVQVMRFGDATGAFSAFTFYRDPAMRTQKIGDEAASSGTSFIVRAGAMLVRVVPANNLSRQDANGLLAGMQALVLSLPRVGGPDAMAPVLPGLLPAPGLARQTIHYAIGPAGYNGPLPARVIDFSRDAEAVTAQYRLIHGGTAALTLLMLPTPQIAGAQLRAVGALPDAALHVATHRTGPLVEVVSGNGVSQKDAQTLLSEVRYVSDVTIDQPQGYTSEVAKAAKLLLNIAILTGMLAIAAVSIALFLGFGRVWIRRLRGKPASSVLDDEFIRLKI